MSGRESLDPTAHVSRNSDVYLMRLWQVQVLHDLDELFTAEGEPRVQSPLLLHGGHCEPMVIMSRVDQTVSWKREDLFMD